MTDRVVLITGGGSGIGLAIARRLVQEDAAVILNGRDEGKLQQAVEAISKEGGICVEAPGDITDEAKVQEVVEIAVGAFGRLDSLVNNAGAAVRNLPADKTSAADWDAMQDVNLRAAWMTSRLAVEEMRRCGEGVILNIASNLGVVGLPGMAGYMAAKGGLMSLTRSMAIDYGSEGIRVNCLCPGLVRTAMTETLPDFAEKQDFYTSRAPLGRIGTPEDVAGLAAFLLGPESSWVTGQSIVVDGGYTIQ